MKDKKMMIDDWKDYFSVRVRHRPELVFSELTETV